MHQLKSRRPVSRPKAKPLTRIKLSQSSRGLKTAKRTKRHVQITNSHGSIGPSSSQTPNTHFHPLSTTQPTTLAPVRIVQLSGLDHQTEIIETEAIALPAATSATATSTTNSIHHIRAKHSPSHDETQTKTDLTTEPSKQPTDTKRTAHTYYNPRASASSYPQSYNTQPIQMMSHSPQSHQIRHFQTQYNTVPQGQNGGQNYDNNTSNNNQDGMTKYNTPYASPSQQGKGVFTSSHFKLTRETLVAYLTRKNLTFKHSGDKTIIMECPLCPKPTYGKPDNLWKLCLFDNGAFVCLRCQSKGSWYDFKSKLGDLPNITNAAGRPIYQRHQQIESNAMSLDDEGAGAQMQYLREQQEEYKQISQTDCEKMVSDLDHSPLILDWFENTRKIRRETLIRYKVGSTKAKFPKINPATRAVDWVEEDCMTFPWTDRKSATDDNNVLYQRVKVRSSIEKKNMRLLPKGGSWGFFGWHTVPIQAKHVIITEGELDAMSIYQTTGLPAISLPNGANSLPPALLPSLERFEKITLWLDDDQAGHAAVESMSQKLGVGRTYHIPGGYGAKDANEALQKGLNIGSILDTATRQQHKQISTFQSFRHEVKRMFFDPNTQVGIQYPNMPILQSLIKGHRRGELTILTGGTGVGKTTLLTQLSLELASQGVNTLWGSFEIRNPRLVKTLMKQHAAVLGVVLNEQHPEAFDYIADKFEELPFNFLKFYGSSPVQEVIEAMEYATYVHDTQHIILDNLQFMLSGQGRGTGDKFDLQDRAIEAFRQFASQRNVHVTLVIHPRKEQDNSSLGLASVFGSAKATQEADNVMIIQGGLPRTVLRNIQLPDDGQQGKKASTSTQLKQSTSGDLGQHGGFDDPIIGEIMGTFFRTIEIRKNRWDGDLGAVPLRFDKSSSRFYELTSDDISLGLGEFIAKQKKLKQLDLIKHMNQLPGTSGIQQPSRSGFNNMAQNHQHHQSPQHHNSGFGSNEMSKNDKFKAKAQAKAALAEHFSSGNLNADAQREIRQQFTDAKVQDAMNNGSTLTQQQEVELQRQFDQMFGLTAPTPQSDGDDDIEAGSSSGSDDGHLGDAAHGIPQHHQQQSSQQRTPPPPQAPTTLSGVSYGSPQAMAIRNLENSMLDDMADQFEGTKTSSGNFQNHPKFQQLQAKQREFVAISTKLPGIGGSDNNVDNEKSQFKKHTAPVGYSPTLDIVFE